MTLAVHSLPLQRWYLRPSTTLLRCVAGMVVTGLARIQRARAPPAFHRLVIVVLQKLLRRHNEIHVPVGGKEKKQAVPAS